MLHCPWDSLGKNTGVGWHFLLQGIFLTQGSNPCLLHCWGTPYQWATWETLSRVKQGLAKPSMEWTVLAFIQPLIKLFHKTHSIILTALSTKAMVSLWPGFLEGWTHGENQLAKWTSRLSLLTVSYFKLTGSQFVTPFRFLGMWS